MGTGGQGGITGKKERWGGRELNRTKVSGQCKPSLPALPGWIRAGAELQIPKVLSSGLAGASRYRVSASAVPTDAAGVCPEMCAAPGLSTQRSAGQDRRSWAGGRWEGAAPVPCPLGTGLGLGGPDAPAPPSQSSPCSVRTRPWAGSGWQWDLCAGRSRSPTDHQDTRVHPTCARSLQPPPDTSVALGARHRPRRTRSCHDGAATGCASPAPRPALPVSPQLSPPNTPHRGLHRCSMRPLAGSTRTLRWVCHAHACARIGNCRARVPCPRSSDHA